MRTMRKFANLILAAGLASCCAQPAAPSINPSLAIPRASCEAVSEWLDGAPEPCIEFDKADANNDQLLSPQEFASDDPYIMYGENFLNYAIAKENLSSADAYDFVMQLPRDTQVYVFRWGSRTDAGLQSLFEYAAKNHTQTLADLIQSDTDIDPINPHVPVITIGMCRTHRLPQNVRQELIYRLKHYNLTTAFQYQDAMILLEGNKDCQ